MFRKNFAVLALLGFSVLIASCGGADEMDARIMSIFRVDGDGVSLARATGESIGAAEGMGLHAGYAVSTGLNSFCFINLDADSIVKMDTTTDITIAQLTDRLLRINIDRGQVLVDLQWQDIEHELEAIIGNTVISVRGTKFVAGLYVGGEAIISVLGGSVYVNNVPLEAGYTMRVLDGLEMIYEVEPIDFASADDFLLNAAGITIDYDAQLPAQEAFVYDEGNINYHEELEGANEYEEFELMHTINTRTFDLLNRTLGELNQILGYYTHYEYQGGSHLTGMMQMCHHFDDLWFGFYFYGRRRQGDHTPLTEVPVFLVADLSHVIDIDPSETTDVDALNRTFEQVGDFLEEPGYDFRIIRLERVWTPHQGLLVYRHEGTVLFISVFGDLSSISGSSTVTLRRY